MNMMIARPTLRCGSTISAPLLVIVVKLLNARIDSVIDAVKPAIGMVSADAEAGSNVNPLAASAAIQKTAMPPIFRNAMTAENRPTERLPEMLTRYAKTISPTPSTGVRTLSAPRSNGLRT